ncbi:hypothetical protein B0H14DRAFT_2894796 [Mycena olivaceomarginata]|nr:hypothetical protein B0H14DRAFT_2894796 [Mycena olivaceomarginata]
MTDTVDFVLQRLDTALKAREYIQDLHNAPNGRQKLVSEMEDLQRLLKELRARIKANPSSRIVQQMNTQLTTLKYTMEELTRDLRPGKGQIARFARQLTWNLWNKKEGGGLLLDSWLILDIWDKGHTPPISTTVTGYDNTLDATTTSQLVVPDAAQSSKSPSPLPTRTATLAMTPWPGGMCVYSQSGDGNIHEEFLDQNGKHHREGPKFAPSSSCMVPRFTSFGTLKGSCAAASTLCGMSADAMPGTHMAEVHSEDAGRIVLFFQDKAGFLCSRGCRPTPISATTWSHTEDIRVYFQDEDNALREFRGSFNGGWRMGEFTAQSSKIHRSMAAISWFAPEMKPGPEIRVYIQDDTNIVIEWSYSVNTEWTLLVHSPHIFHSNSDNGKWTIQG